MSGPAPLLQVRDLAVRFGSEAEGVRAVDGVSFDLARGETLGIVGESGSGKSVTALALLRLIARPGRVVAGSIMLEGQDLLALDEAAMRDVRGRRVAMIFQDPMTSLNPVLTIGRQLTEILEVQDLLPPWKARGKAVEVLRMVGIPEPEQRLGQYPHNLSGGQRQRVMIAIAIACRPAILVADEPTTALDVTIQAQILDLLRALQREIGMAMVLITHDLGVVAGMADRVAVMYAGRIVETAPVDALFDAQHMPYSAGLLAATPRLGGGGAGRLSPIRGRPPEPLGPTTICRFAPRCDLAAPVCRERAPALVPVGEAHLAACHFAPQVPALLHAHHP